MNSTLQLGRESCFPQSCNRSVDRLDSDLWAHVVAVWIVLQHSLETLGFPPSENPSGVYITAPLALALSPNSIEVINSSIDLDQLN